MVFWQQQFDVVFLQPRPDIRPQFPGELDQLIGILLGRAACIVVLDSIPLDSTGIEIVAEGRMKSV